MPEGSRISARSAGGPGRHEICGESDPEILGWDRIFEPLSAKFARFWFFLVILKHDLEQFDSFSFQALTRLLPGIEFACIGYGASDNAAKGDA